MSNTRSWIVYLQSNNKKSHLFFVRFSEKQTVIVPMSDNNVLIRFENYATFSIRFFFLIESLNPVKVYVFQNGMLLLDEVGYQSYIRKLDRRYFKKSFVCYANFFF